MHLSRRDFLKKGGQALFLLSLAGPLGLLDFNTPRAFAAPTSNVLVVIQLSGGNDGLNTVIPYTKGIYYDNRPTLGIAEKNVLPIGSGLGLHPSLTGLQKLFQRKKLAIVNGVGYPNPNRSHFRSMEIWHTGEPSNLNVQTGWLGRYLDVTASPQSNPLPGVSVGSSSPIFTARNHYVPSIEEIERFQVILRKANADEKAQQMRVLRQMYATTDNDPSLKLIRSKGTSALNAADQVQSKVASTSKGTGYNEKSAIAMNLRKISQFITSGIGTRTFCTSYGGFDEHAREKEDHAARLLELDAALSAFYADLEAKKAAEQVTVLVFSEFGRRVKENASQGTDHGTAAPVFVLGGKVKGGLYGAMPDLSKLVDGDLKYTVDFRSVYATLLEKWLQAPAKDILGGSYPLLPFL